MIIVEIFIALVWASAVVGALAAGVMATVAYARWTDRLGTALGAAFAGMGARVLLTCAALAMLIGGPLLALGWA